MKVIYRCGICECCHPWNWNGDCREDANRYADAEDFAARNRVPVSEVEEREWEDRVEADAA